MSNYIPLLYVAVCLQDGKTPHRGRRVDGCQLSADWQRGGDEEID